MNIKKNELQELTKGGRKVIEDKIREIKLMITKTKLETKGGVKIARRSVARLMTALKELK